MSQPPPPPGPVVSPDGRHYWDGARWVPRDPPQTAPGPSTPPDKSTPVVAVIAAVALIVAGLIWYFGFYDTAAGKCNRGDLGACVVVAGQQAAASASAAADQRSQQEAAMASGCTLVWDPNHNMRLTYIGLDRDSNCASAKSQGWTDANRVDGSTIVCANTNLVVEDTGGRDLGTNLCNQLKLAVQP